MSPRSASSADALPAQPGPPTSDTALEGRLADYRRTRTLVERNLLAVATSVDGRTFELQASLHDLAIRRAGYVVLTSGDRTRLGQVTELRAVSEDVSTGPGGEGSSVRIRAARGSGIVLDDADQPFHDAAVRPATPEEVGAWCARHPTKGAGLDVGELLLAPGTPAVLDSAGLDRHTFMCGQSGSGKTYSLGVLLERVLTETSLRVVVLDPNSDYVGLPSLREGADPQLADRYAGVPQQVAVWTDDPTAAHPLRLRFADLDGATQAAVLDLDPIRDREEYAFLTDLLERHREGESLATGLEDLLDSGVPGARALGQRASNLGVLGWRVWSPHLPSIVDELREPTSRGTVVDLGSLATPQEQRLVAEAALTTLWDARHSRAPCLVVVDEAHNVCPADPVDRLTRLSSERAVQIAAEGRKYGLYLLTSTQRPHKVHENVVSQCDNLLLMRMNSQADLADLSRIFSFVPEGLVAGAASFRQGQALVAGKVMPYASYVRMGERVSQEGGADVPTTWARRR